MPEKQCGTCQFYHKDTHPDHSEDHFYCKRHSPTHYGWWAPYPSNWCGDWQAKADSCSAVSTWACGNCGKDEKIGTTHIYRGPGKCEPAAESNVCPNCGTIVRHEHAADKQSAVCPQCGKPVNVWPGSTPVCSEYPNCGKADSPSVATEYIPRVTEEQAINPLIFDSVHVAHSLYTEFGELYRAIFRRGHEDKRVALFGPDVAEQLRKQLAGGELHVSFTNHEQTMKIEQDEETGGWKGHVRGKDINDVLREADSPSAAPESPPDTVRCGMCKSGSNLHIVDGQYYCTACDVYTGVGPASDEDHLKIMHDIWLKSGDRCTSCGRHKSELPHHKPYDRLIASCDASGAISDRQCFTCAATQADTSSDGANE